jgi:hypothetical protein
VFVQGTWLGEDEEDRAANLEWAIASLRKLDAARGSDATIRTDLAEALSKLDAHRAEAKEILEKLATTDEIASPRGYAVLAELRGAAGDESGKRAALDRCAKMAPEGSLCAARRS